MTELVAVQGRLALFQSGNDGVVIDTSSVEVLTSEPIAKLLTGHGWVAAHSNDVSRACFEVASAAFVAQQEVQIAASGARLLRVPKQVQTEVRDLTLTDAFTPVQFRIAESLLSGSVSSDDVVRSNVFFSNGAFGDAARAWSAKVSEAHQRQSMTADAGLDGEQPQGLIVALDDLYGQNAEEPHPFFQLEPSDEYCALCSSTSLDPRHIPMIVPVDGVGDDDLMQDAHGSRFFAALDPEDSSDYFRVNKLFSLKEDGSWWEREFGEWTPTQAPDSLDSLLQLDPDALEAASSQLDVPGASYAELSLSEAQLFAAARQYMQPELLEAIFRVAPYVDPQIRSVNASKQMRDAHGRFFSEGATVSLPGGGTGRITKVDHASGQIEVLGSDGATRSFGPKELTVAHPATDAPDATVAPHEDSSQAAAAGNYVARLGGPATVVPDVKVAIETYLTNAAKQRSVEANGPSADAAPVTAAAPAPDPALVIPKDAPAPEAVAAPAPAASDDNANDPVDASDVKPLYLAIVDKDDTQAVTKLLALISVPSSPQATSNDSTFKGPGNTVPECFQRQAGQWIPDPEGLADLESAAPPPVVELDAADTPDVLAQVDASAPPEAAPDEPSSPAAAPQAEAPVAAALLTRFEMDETGLTASQAYGAIQLTPYEESGFPADVVCRLDELAAGVDTHPAAAQRLRDYWSHGPGADKIVWNTPGDYNRCVVLLSKYLGDRAHGYCQLRHFDATGAYAGHAPGDGPRVEHGGHGHD